MYSTATVQKTYTPEELLSYVTQQQVFSYLGFPTQYLESGRKFTSPFREDKHPDCRFSLGADGKYRFLDPARGISLDWLDAVMLVQSVDFPGALRWVADTFLSGQKSNPVYLQALALHHKALPQPESPKQKLIQIKRRGMNGHDRAWWGQYNIQLQQLKEGRVSAISDYWVNERHFAAPKKAYCYEEEDGYKLYFPENEHRYRFLSSTRVLAGYDLLPQSGGLLLITSSKKDVLCLRSFGYEAVAPQGEAMDIPAQKLWELKQRFRSVVIFYDNDEPGMLLAAQKKEKWQVSGYIHTPAGEPKDPSDYCKTYGAAATASLLTTLTHEFRKS